MFLVSGCSITAKSCKFNDGHTLGSDVVEAHYVEGKLAWRSPSAGYNVATRNTHVLQNAAQLTIDNGHKYFAFIAPKGEINNKDGSLINTAKGFIDRCVPSAANPFTIGNSACGWTGNNVKVKAIITMYDKQPIEMVTYDAHDVKDYMIKYKHWREDGLDGVLDKCTVKALKRR